ncbi:MAG: YslB family protein [Candidatus Limosilactobacillus merdavium]|uniref:YslB family protein n=1 Tax=Candidatus Limosilactobacillus merdavium TaxID=2838651 RepID=A0A9E2NUM3_9LACO|nr:YslB family protein [Candidatus Limosilactobacillus merdavium]
MSQKLYDSLLNSNRGLMNGSLRDVILPAILGKETDEMLYWIGKDVARQFPVGSLEDLQLITSQLGFGELSLQKKTATSQLWRLGGQIVQERIAQNDEQTSFGLELGFIAQEIEFQLMTISEAEIIERKKDSILIKVKSDPQSDADSERTELVTFLDLHNHQSTDDKPKKDKKSKKKKNSRKEK